MGLFANPLSYAGYPPGVTGTPTTQNSTVRAATLQEATDAVLTNTYISPATQEASVQLDFASPPVLGYGSTTARPVAATSISATGNVNLGTGTSPTTHSFANSAPAASRTITFMGANDAQNDTWNIFGGANTANTQAMNIFGGVNSGGTQSVSFFAGNSSGGTQSFSVLTGNRAGTVNLGTGAAAHVLNLGSATSTIGFFGATAVAKPASTDDLRTALINLGLYTTGGASPLNLNGGAFNAGTVTSAGAITATNGNMIKGTAGNKDVYSSVATTITAGANSAGTVTLSGGTATVSTTAVTASSKIRMTRQGIGSTGAAALGQLSVGTITAGVSFIINAVQAADATALQASDVSSIWWEIVN